jgi:hypothetical protein
MCELLWSDNIGLFIAATKTKQQKLLAQAIMYSSGVHTTNAHPLRGVSNLVVGF